MTDSLLFAGFTRRATVITPDTSGIVTDTPAIVDAVAAHRTEQAAMVEAVTFAEDESKSVTARRHARRLIDSLDSSRAAAEADVERAVRAANPTAEYAAVMAAVCAL